MSAQMASLFADKGTLMIDETAVSGRARIAAFLSKTYGGGRSAGLAPGALNTQVIEEPVLNLSADGMSARARWEGMFLLGDGKGAASIEGGIFAGDYVKEGGKWKIAALHFYHQYAGAYETGWSNWGGGDLGIVPFRYTPDEAGVPIPAALGAPAPAKASLADLERRVQTMNDEDKVRNLQNAYGYYVDRKMWDDVADLFAADGVLEIGGVGVYRGPASVRRAMERMGAQGLRHGELNDKLQVDTIVTIAPGGHEAWARGIEFAMVGEADKEQGFWEVNVFVNRFVKEGGLWKLREMRLFPHMKTDYYQGWGKNRIVETAPAGPLAPDAPVPAADRGDQDRLVPLFVAANPVTGARVGAPAGMKLVALAPLTGAIPSKPKAPSGDTAARMAEVARKLAVSKAWDGSENVSSSYGQFIDDSRWPEMGAIFGKTGSKEAPFAGYYRGGDRIAGYGLANYGQPKDIRPSIAYHWRIQPVILVAEDGRSANVRTRLFQPATSKPGTARLGAGVGSGMYQDQTMLEDGIWRLWNLALDEHFFSSGGWKTGWAKVKDKPSASNPPPAAILAKFPPDLPITALGKREEHYRGGVGQIIEWPSIAPMWFPYKNLVSGRAPELFWGNCVPCDYDPSFSLDKHGYLLPPTGPVPDIGE
jgi:hypothetical protein